MAFAGFTQQAFAFFMELAFNNTPQTMREKRDVFNKEILLPLKELSHACEQVLFPVDKHIDFRPVMGGTISRIRRDTRFTREKHPYRDYMWLDFRRKHEDFHLGFCFSISPRASSVFVGMHQSSAQSRNTIRRYVLRHAPQYIKLHAALLKKGYTFNGEDYKRAMTQAENEDVYAFGQKRWFSYRRDIALPDTMKPEFASQLQNDLRELVPMYSFLRKGLDEQ